MKSVKIALLALLPILTLTGCASVASGTGQNVSVSTGNVTGAKCKLSNGKGNWIIDSTPGTTYVSRNSGSLVVNCRKASAVGSKVVGSSMNSTTLGNLVVGGVIGTGVDMIDGAAYNYPSQIYVPMRNSGHSYSA